jgi:isoleucyl-tRNA synthetase
VNQSEGRAKSALPGAEGRAPSALPWYSSKDLEAGVRRFWAENNVFGKLVDKNAGGEPWSFLDGPITANNPMGIHHAWGRSLKDAYQRYQAMRGRRQRFQNGFDCQGLWVEVEVEKELGLGAKREIEAYGVDRFVRRCKERVRKYADTITEQSIRLGMWMDWEKSYYTFSDENNYMIWHFLKRCHERGLVYKGHDVMPWCPRCGTGISQHEMQEGYRPVTHRTVVAVFPVAGRPGEGYLAWTTTPWTLTANVALALHPDLDYVTVRLGARLYHLAESRAAHTFAGKGAWTIVNRRRGSELIAESPGYVGPYDDPNGTGAAATHRLIPWKGVSQDEGTGIVHVAPGCGPEDFVLSREHGLEAPCPIDEAGVFLAGYGPFTGKNAAEVSRGVLADLERRGLAFGTRDHLHTYPHCWRCNHELLYRLVDEWFISVDPWRADVLRAAESARWIPGFCRDLELDWLRNMRDWMISKKRYWGLALPIWVCPACAAFDVIGSREELAGRAIEGWASFEGQSPHRPQIDGVFVRCTRCGQTAHRIPDVGNPWLDAGIVPYSTTGYLDPRSAWRTWVPADLVLEGFPQQFRGWFYSLLAMSTILEGTAPFRTLVGHASVRDERGEEMHKSRGNAIWLDDALEQAGADTVRWLFFGQELGTNLDFSFKSARAIRGGFLNTLWNCHSFYATYAAVSGFVYAHSTDTGALPDLERWILSRLHDTVQRCTRAFDGYDARAATREIESLVDSLSNVYIRNRRRLFWRGPAEPEAVGAYRTLYVCLRTVLRLAAPLIPHLAEQMYQNVVRPADPGAPESVHLCAYPVADPGAIDPALLDAMETVARVQQAALSARKAAGVKVRQPLPLLRVALAEPERRAAVERFRDHLLREVNVHAVRVETRQGEAEPGEVAADLPGGQILLDTRITPALAREGMVRELVRRLQVLRKEQGLEIDDRIRLRLTAGDGDLSRAVAEHRSFVMDELLCVDLVDGQVGPDSVPLQVGGAVVQVAMAKA